MFVCRCQNSASFLISLMTAPPFRPELAGRMFDRVEEKPRSMRPDICLRIIGEKGTISPTPNDTGGATNRLLAR